MADEKYNEQRHTSGFIKEYVFPGGCVPSLNHVVSSMAAGSRFRYYLNDKNLSKTENKLTFISSKLLF